VQNNITLLRLVLRTRSRSTCFHKFRQGKPGLFDAAQKFHRWLFLHQHDVILPAKKLRQSFQVAHQLRLMPRGIERFALRDARLGQRVEDENIWRASPGLRIDIQLRDELRVEPRRAPTGDVQGDALGPLRRKRKFKLAAESVPVTFIRIFPAAKPFQAIGDVADFIAINFFEQLRRPETFVIL